MKTFYFLLITLLHFSINAQTINEKWIKDNYTKKEYTITMRDGVKLFTAVYTPNDTKEKHPFLLTRTPYSCAPYGEDKIQSRLHQFHWKEYLNERYIFVFHDVRGRWKSERPFMDLRPFNPNNK